MQGLQVDLSSLQSRVELESLSSVTLVSLPPFLSEVLGQLVRALLDQRALTAAQGERVAALEVASIAYYSIASIAYYSIA